MPTVTFKLGYESYNGSEGALMSPSELLEQFFHGIPICTADGRELTQDTIRQKIASAQVEIENLLSVKTGLQIQEETCDFVMSDWESWGFMKTNFPIREVLSLTGFLGTIQQVIYPDSWVSLHKNKDEKNLWRTIHLVPAGQSVNVNFNSVVALGITPHMGFFGLPSIPNYWNVKYCTGFKKVPADLVEAIGKIASISLFAILGDILLGAGIASQSLSYDGLSESITTTQSAENSAYSARVRQYAKELKTDLPRMKDFYVGIRIQVL